MGGGRGHGRLYFRLDIILVKGLSKHTLNMYFSGMKKDPKYMFLHVFFLICPSPPFKNLSLWPETQTFFPTLHVFAPLNDVHAYFAWSKKKKKNLIVWFFLTLSFHFFPKLMEILLSQESSYFSHSPWKILLLQHVPFGRYYNENMSGYGNHN